MKNAILISLGIFAVKTLVRNHYAINRNPDIHIVEWLPAPRRAMTLPPWGIYIRKEYENDSRIFNHEMIHWRQYQNMGLLPFYKNYIGQYLRYGYDKMSMEIEARYEECDYCKLNYTHCYN